MRPKTALIREAWVWIRQGTLIFALFLLIGETASRLPWADSLLRLVFDGELGWRMAPAQRGCLPLGNLSFLSPPIGLNGDGYRNRELDRRTPKILCLGSSEALGTGVEDGEVWTQRLEDRLRPIAPDLDVVNAAAPAYGPFQCRVVLDRYLRRETPRGVVVRASMTDYGFSQPTPAELEALRGKYEKNRRIESFSRFLPLLYFKAKAQMMVIKGLFALPVKAGTAGSETDGAGAGIRMWQAQRAHWRAIADTCAGRSIPVLFFVDDPLDTDAGRVLADSMRADFARPGPAMPGIARPGIEVERLGSAWFGFHAATAEAKAREYSKRYTLGRDPHSNADKHERVAEFVAGMAAGVARKIAAGGPPQ